MAERRLSFVIPAHNEEALIGEALEAILASVARASGVSRKELWLPDTSFEVIVADDASRDSTTAIVGKFADDVGVQWSSASAGPVRRHATRRCPFGLFERSPGCHLPSTENASNTLPGIPAHSA
jgi:glycosyltransferase involved in cell wall biosynthesis